MQKIILKDIGLTNYKDAWNYQNKLFQKIIVIKLDNRNNNTNNPTPNYFLFTEHHHVYTVGKNGNLNNLLLSENQLQEKGIQFFRSNRGGDITYHGFGQIVGYPILNLTNFKTDIHVYMRNLEEIIIRTLAEYDITGQRSKGETGVWLQIGTPFARKICALGVRTSRWVTMHGFALNISTNLEYFDHIIPCGIRGKSITSLEKELNKKVNINEVKEKIKKHFSSVFNSTFI